jgi:hypothetical protein
MAARWLGIASPHHDLTSPYLSRLVPVALHAASWPLSVQLASLLAAAGLLTWGVSEVTYRLVERPGIAAGRWVVRQINHA